MVREAAPDTGGTTLLSRLANPRILIVLLVAVCATALLALRGGAVGSHADESPDVLVTEDHDVDLSASTAEDSAADNVAVVDHDDLPDDATETDLVIGRRETFYDAMRRVDASHRDIMALVGACRPYRDLEKIRGGLTFRVAVGDGGLVHRMSFDLDDDESYLVFDREAEGGFHVHMNTYPVQRHARVVSGAVDVSVFQSLQDAGAPTALATKMNDILGWEVDFRRDVRAGDRFRILYEEIHRDGRFVRTGAILAMEYVNRGEAHRGFRYVDEEGSPGYYDDAGRNLEKQLMRAPLEYSRISSGFTPRRLHPIHKRWMSHYGVDYAAPVGTPVRAAGSGVVLDARYKKHNGRFVRIKHTNQSYETYYLHLSRFAKGVAKGTRVRQGQIIGYVGATGDATGPCLDYRVKVDGHWKDPRRLKLPPAEPITGDALAAFRAQTALAVYSLASAPDVCSPTTVRHGLPLTPPWIATTLLAPAESTVTLAAVAAGSTSR